LHVELDYLVLEGAVTEHADEELYPILHQFLGDAEGEYILQDGASVQGLVEGVGQP
jgi:hypothetical protein